MSKALGCLGWTQLQLQAQWSGVQLAIEVFGWLQASLSGFALKVPHRAVWVIAYRVLLG